MINAMSNIELIDSSSKKGKIKDIECLKLIKWAFR